MTSEGLGEMFEGDCRQVYRKISAVPMGGPAEGLTCADPGERTPISTNRNSCKESCRNKLNYYFGNWPNREGEGSVREVDCPKH